MLEVLILSAIQGITEFLPISSTGHTILISKIFNISVSSLLLNISLHIGSFLAVSVYYFKDIIIIFKDKKKFLILSVAVLPVLLLGFLMSETGYINKFRNIEIIGWTTILFGLMLFISDKKNNEKSYENDFSIKSALIVGLIHSLAIIPGVSRSGIAITACRFLSFKREDSVKISFIISIPTLFILSFYGIYNLSKEDEVYIKSINMISILLSFIFSYITIKLFIKFIKKFDLSFFVIYRVLIGSLILIYAYF
tara:strand:+ start:1166 stop:1924 length:759 start_codon:yes stop_codon:yes gene_type:complete